MQSSITVADPYAARPICRIRALAAALTASMLLDCDASALETPSMHGGEYEITNVIFDTDMWADIDDVLALAMLHALHDRREINLLAVTLSTQEPWSASYVDAVNTFHGHPAIAIGMAHGGLTAAGTMEKARAIWPCSPSRK